MFFKVNHLAYLVLYAFITSIGLCQFQDTQNVNKVESVNFTHEICQMETLSSKEFLTFYPVDKFFNRNGVIELLVRFMGIADGHIALTVNTTDSNPRNISSYVISLGSYNNKVSEIRRGHILEFKMNTPGILSEYQYRGFIIRYNPVTGGIYVFSEGSEIPLLHLVDPNPLRINYFAFSTWNNRIAQVAFNCKAKDAQSKFATGDADDNSSGSKEKGCQKDTVSGPSFKQFYNINDVSQNYEVSEMAELLVRFKGASDGHVMLAETADDTDPLYLIVLGSYSNKMSEIRRSKWGEDVFKINTPGILSDQQFRGFLIKLNKKSGELWVHSEGSEMPLLHWIDPSPLHVRYFSFAAYNDVVLQVAFNCKISSKHVIIPPLISRKVPFLVVII